MTAPVDKPDSSNTPTADEAEGTQAPAGSTQNRGDTQNSAGTDGTTADGNNGVAENGAGDNAAENGAAEGADVPAGGLAAQAGAVTEDKPKPKRGRPKGSTNARKTRTVELTLTVSGGAEGDWQADLRHGTERVVQGLAVPAAAVSRAATALHPDVSGAIETVLDEARAQHRQRLEQLEAEMSKVKQALAELDSDEESPAGDSGTG